MGNGSPIEWFEDVRRMKVHSMKSSDVFYFYNSSVGDLTQYIYKYSKIPGGVFRLPRDALRTVSV